MDPEVIVIGSGVSGLLSALALSKEGKHILIIEKDDYVGGNLRTYTIDGWTVDTGVHAITHVDDGPLTKLMADYFDVIPKFVPYGGYHVRTKDKLTVFPWTMQGWLNFDVLPKKDRLILAQTLGSSVAMKVFGYLESDQSIYDFLKHNDLTERTWKFINTLSFFMSGKSMKETPIWRLMKGARYSEENEAQYLSQKILGSLTSFSKLLSYDGSYHQAYPKGGVGIITDSIIRSFPPGMVEIRTGEKVDAILGKDKVEGVKTSKGTYDCDIVVYSGFMKDLPNIVEGMDEDYSEGLTSLKQTETLTIWLGLDEKLPQFKYHGTEIWFGFDGGKHYWAMPTSNYNPAFAPPGKQLVGFSAILEGDQKTEEKALMKAIVEAIPGIEDHIVFKHIQKTIPEKAAITTGSKFPKVKSPKEGLYLVGTDTDTRSMGVTRAAFSVLELLAELAPKEKT